MKEYAFIIFAILLLPLSSYSNERLSIILKERNLEHKDKIEFRVCNEKIDEVIGYYEVSVQKRWLDEWVMVHYDVECAFNTFCDRIGFRSTLQKGQCEKHSVNIEKITLSLGKEDKPSGEFRLFTMGFSSTNFNLVTLGVSESFFVK
jgi:hypothetical protein